ncbi:disease resistance protein RPP13-like, partial [Juglans microcarpa x Juglans regia]|uniref:disease resistance protein RPP13-like n=1 Tax=Juglans microcarpa x Juglans regia TaxID=2249226 RepID=UPI001B7F1E0F
MAYCAVTFLLHRLSRLIDEEPHFFRGVEVQAESIRIELSWVMHKCVEYFDKERDEHDRVEQYLRQIRDIVFDVEDAIDMLILKGATAKRRQMEAKVLDDVVKKIKGIKVGIEEIATNIEKFGIEGGAATASHVDPTAEETRQRRKRDVEEDDVVGFVKHFAALAGWLTKGIPNLGVIPIVGMSGIGKTTIARKLFNSDCIKTHFNCHVWVPVSRSSTAEEVLLNILEEMPITLELGRTLDKISKELLEKLSTYLLEKRYLVVLDGIPSLQLWEDVRSAFPDNFNGSRLLITTRTVNMSPPARFACSYSLPLLNRDQSWELFHKKVFRGGECPPVLETLGKQTIEYCHGLPLIIVALGSCLANTEKTYEAWSKVIDEINLSLRRDFAWKKILKLIYSHLPLHLKPCLSHLKKYEEGLEIPVEFLIQEWISLGFIEQSGERNTVDVARDYFKELVDRSLIQVVSRRSDGEATTWSIHDLVRQLCVSTHAIGRAKASKEENKGKAIIASAKYLRTPLNRGTVKMASIRSEVVTLLKQLIEGNSKLDVISITGMGGLGKSTLAREIYNNDAIKSRFNCRVWMSVSQNLRTRELLLLILKCQIPKSDDLIRSLEDMSRDELKKKLLEYLRGKRYLIVMDDVWITEIWDEIRSAFPDDFNGSRILITSRLQEVASHTSLNPPYSLPFITEDESWNLFREMVFPRGYPEEFLADLGRQLAQGCLGIPLSIVVLGGVLANKGKTHRIWSKVTADVNWCQAQATTLRDDILNLSYTHLPRNLKPCFFYLGAYPKDFEIPASQLIQLWIAEGLINCGSNEDIEDVAENYLKELIARNLIQVVERRSDGGAKTCHVHDLVRDLCISKGAEEKFFDVSENVNLSSWKKSRRLSIQGSTLDLYMSSNTPSPSIARSLLFFGEDTYGGFDPNHWKWVEENFNLLRVLNFGNLNVYSIPTWIKRLIHLRYLRVQSDALKVIPASIGNLTNIETLDLRGTFLNSLPIGIWKLRNLRNLYMSGPVSLPNQSDTEIKALSNLQVLSTVSLDTQTVRPIVEAKLPNVRKLGIWFASNESNSEAGDALASLQHLHRLQKLKIINCSEILSLPNAFPKTITKITLRQVCLGDGDCMKVLGNLVNLQILKLQSCFSSQLCIIGESFPA